MLWILYLPRKKRAHHPWSGFISWCSVPWFHRNRPHVNGRNYCTDVEILLGEENACRKSQELLSLNTQETVHICGVPNYVCWSKFGLEKYLGGFRFQDNSDECFNSQAHHIFLAFFSMSFTLSRTSPWFTKALCACPYSPEKQNE